MSLSTLSTKQPEDKLTDTVTYLVNIVNKTLVQTYLTMFARAVLLPVQTQQTLFDENEFM